MKRQKELAKRVNEEAMKRFQDHKDEQISKRFAIPPIPLPCVSTVSAEFKIIKFKKIIFLILCLTDQSCRRMLRTNMFRLFREMLRFKTSASLLVCSLVTQTLSFCDFTYPLSSIPLPSPLPSPLSRPQVRGNSTASPWSPPSFPHIHHQGANTLTWRGEVHTIVLQLYIKSRCVHCMPW